MKYYCTDEEMKFLCDYTKNTDVLLEWGSGGSTIYLQDRVKKIVSIEHDLSWYDKLLPKLNDNVRYHYIPPTNIDWEQQFHKDGNKNEKGDDGGFEDFSKYVVFPTTYGIKFDVILIDGRARAACSFISSLILKRSGSIFIHDFGPACSHPSLPYRTYYDIASEWLHNIDNVGMMYRFTVK
jgi:hypothetical protein